MFLIRLQRRQAGTIAQASAGSWLPPSAKSREAPPMRRRATARWRWQQRVRRPKRARRRRIICGSAAKTVLREVSLSRETPRERSLPPGSSDTMDTTAVALPPMWIRLRWWLQPCRDVLVGTLFILYITCLTETTNIKEQVHTSTTKITLRRWILTRRRMRLRSWSALTLTLRSLSPLLGSPA